MTAGHQQHSALASELNQASLHMLPEQRASLGVVQDDSHRQHMAKPVVPVTPTGPEPPAVLRLFAEERDASLDLQRKKLTRRLLRTIKRLYMGVDAVILYRLLPEQPAPRPEHQGCRTHPQRLVRGGAATDPPSMPTPTLLAQVCLGSTVLLLVPGDLPAGVVACPPPATGQSAPRHAAHGSPTRNSF